MEETLLADVVAAALKAGADAAEAVGAERAALGINVRLGKLEEVEREESRDLGLRVFVGKQQATVSGSDVSAEARAIGNAGEGQVVQVRTPAGAILSGVARAGGLVEVVF